MSYKTLNLLLFVAFNWQPLKILHFAFNLMNQWMTSSESPQFGLNHSNDIQVKLQCIEI